MKRIAIALVLGTGMVAAAAASEAENPIANRQGIMKNVNASVAVLVKMAKGEIEFDATSALLALRVINAGSYGYGELFPANAEAGSETEASPKIWENWDGFQATVVKLQTTTAAAIEAPPTSREELGTTLGPIGQVCVECHEAFRIEKK